MGVRSTACRYCKEGGDLYKGAHRECKYEERRKQLGRPERPEKCIECQSADPLNVKGRCKKCQTEKILAYRRKKVAGYRAAAKAAGVKPLPRVQPKAAKLEPHRPLIEPKRSAEKVVPVERIVTPADVIVTKCELYAYLRSIATEEIDPAKEAWIDLVVAINQRRKQMREEHLDGKS